MSSTIDVEATATPANPQTQAVTVRQNMAVGQAMGIKEILEQVKLIQDVMRSVMTEGEHYGTIPGCGDKKTLLQPGAQKLTMTFRLAPEYQIQETDLDRGHKEFRVICTLKSISTGAFVGQGVGCCSSMESKYRYRGGVRKCPKCGKETIIKGKAEYGGGWLCFAKKGGCGAKWADGAQEIESQSIEKAENDNPADTFNTVLKIAKKRAFVDATITATAASDIFTQDVGDLEGEPEETTPKTPQKPPGAPQGVSKPGQAAKASPAPTPQSQGSPKSSPPPERKAPKEAIFADFGTRARLITALTASNWVAAATDYLRAAAILLPNEALGDLQLRWVPVTRGQLTLLERAIGKFVTEGVTAPPYPPNTEPEPAPKPKAPKPESPPPAPKPEAPPLSSAAAEAQKAKDPEWFFEVICPIPNKAQKRDDYMKHPDTIRSLYLAMKNGDEIAQKRLWGFAHHYQPEARTVGNKTYEPSAADHLFREALDAFCEWEKKNGKDTKQEVLGIEHEPGPSEPQDGPDEDSDVPF